MDRFKNKYRIASARAPFWDYAWNAAYFVTICTKNREHWFGKITDGVMDLSDIGEIVQSEWFKTFEMRPDMNLWMGEYVVMPNHFHAIIGIGENEYNKQHTTQRYTTDTTDTTEINNVQTHCNASPQNQFGRSEERRVGKESK